MKLRIEEINNKEVWESFFLESQEKTFLQSWNWGEFQKMMKNKIWRLGIYDDKNLISLALVVEIQAKRGKFLFLPHGLFIKKKEKENNRYKILKFLSEELKRINKKEKTSFIRIAPIWKRNEENIKIFKNLGFRDAPIHIHPEIVWELDINPSENELLMNMRKTTRYLIRQAQKNSEIEISQSQNLKDIEKFNEIYQKTVHRQHFIPFSLDYLKNEFLAFQPDNQISIFLGKYKNEIINGGIFIFWQNIGFYHHGASSLKYSKIPISYLLLWKAIKEAKERGCQKFNFWGIRSFSGSMEKRNSKFWKHPWAGFTLFKMGFGGYKKEYVKTQDLPFSKKYWLIYLFEKLRKIKRGF